MNVDFQKVKDLIDIIEKLQGFPSLKKIQAAATDELKKLEEECDYELTPTPINQPFPPEAPNPYASSPGPAGATTPSGEVICEDDKPLAEPLPGEPGYVPPPEPVPPPEEPIERRV